MKKVLIFCAGGQESQEALQLEETIEQYKNGNDVTLLSCDESIGTCNDNVNAHPVRCYICKLLQKNNRKRLLPKGIKQASISQYVTNEILSVANTKFEYSDIQALRAIKFHGIDIGLGAVSSYISYTRNLEPIINEKTRHFFDKLLRSQVIMTLVIEQLYKTHKYDLIVLHNGRFAIFKPFLNFAQINDIDYICTESYKDASGIISKDYYYNDIPHNIGPRTAKFIAAWDDAKNKDIDREELGKSFFTRRRNSEATGDKIYSAEQNPTVFVDNWDSTKQNIAIYNSSEDEFCAVSGDFEKEKIFPSQVEGIKTIIEHYKNDRTKHFYLRIHPNLKNINYSYHLDLYKLNYPNLTVIPADSTISSYTLLDHVDKVITFGSTMGIEATYARKPSICIGASFYDRLGVLYLPKNVDEIWRYIDDKSLKDLYSENVLIYGYYFMGIYKGLIHNRFKNIDARILSYKIFGKERHTKAYEKLFGSNRLYLAIRFILNAFNSRTVPTNERID